MAGSHHVVIADASFDPTTVAGCELYLRSDLGVTLSGSTVTAWADQSGNGRNATPVGSPTQVTNVQNGFPSVHFNGTSQYFTLASSAMQGANWSAFAVFKASSLSGQRTLCAEATAGDLYRIFRTNTTNINVLVSDGANAPSVLDTGTTLATGTCYVATGTSANGNPAIAYANGDAGTSASNASVGAYTPTLFTIGAYRGSTTGSFFAGDLMAVIVYNSVLGSTDRANVRDGLKTLYAAY